MKIYTYYSHVPDLPQEDEFKLLLLWRQRWTAAGWEPFILSEHFARSHPLFANLDVAVSKLPSANPAAYERACYLRWLALAKVRGGWMCDYDCFPALWSGERPTEPNSSPLGRFELFFWHNLTGAEMNKLQILQTPCCPSLVYCSQANAERFAQAIITEASQGLGNRPQEDRRHAAHYSDQYSLEDLALRGADWIQRRDVVKLWSDKGWETAPVVHFSNAVMMPGKLMPRYQHIPGLLGKPAP